MDWIGNWILLEVVNLETIIWIEYEIEYPSGYSFLNRSNGLNRKLNTSRGSQFEKIKWVE